MVAGGSHQFGGFLAESLRASDFVVGYDAMHAWLGERLGDHVGDADARAAAEAVAARAATIRGWVGGVATRRRPSLRVQADIARAGLRAAWIGLRDHVRSGGDRSA